MAEQQTCANRPKATMTTPTPPPRTGRNAHFQLACCGRVSGMVLTAVRHPQKRFGRRPSEGRHVPGRLDLLRSAIQLIIGRSGGAIGDGKLGRKPILVACALLQARRLRRPRGARRIARAVTTVECLVIEASGHSGGDDNLRKQSPDAYAHDRTKIAKTAARLGGMQMGVGMLLGPAVRRHANGRGPAHTRRRRDPRRRAGVPRPIGVGARGRRRNTYEDGGEEYAYRTFYDFQRRRRLRYLACASLCQALCRGESAVYSPFMIDIWGAGRRG